MTDPALVRAAECLASAAATTERVIERLRALSPQESPVLPMRRSAPARPQPRAVIG